MTAERKDEGNVYFLTDEQKKAVVDKIVDNTEKKGGIFFTWQGLQELIRRYDEKTPMSKIIADIKSAEENTPKH